MNCVLRQGLTCRTKKESQEATSARKQRNRGAILFGWGDSLIRDMLDAGVFDCLNSEFDDIQVSVLCCVLSVRSPLWQTLQISHYAGKSAGQILEELKTGKDEQVRKLHDTRIRRGLPAARWWLGGGMLLGFAELPAARHLHPACC